MQNCRNQRTTEDHDYHNYDDYRLHDYVGSNFFFSFGTFTTFTTFEHFVRCSEQVVHHKKSPKNDPKMIEKLTGNLMVKIYREKMEIPGNCPFSGVKNSPVPAAIGTGKIPPPNARKRPKSARNVAPVH